MICLNLNVFLGLKIVGVLLGSSWSGTTAVSVDVVTGCITTGAACCGGCGGDITGLDTAPLEPDSPILGNSELNKSSASFPDRAMSGSVVVLVTVSILSLTTSSGSFDICGLFVGLTTTIGLLPSLTSSSRLGLRNPAGWMFSMFPTGLTRGMNFDENLLLFGMENKLFPEEGPEDLFSVCSWATICCWLSC